MNHTPIRYAQMDGLTIAAHTNTVAMLIKSDSGVNTWRLPRPSASTPTRKNPPTE